MPFEHTLRAIEHERKKGWLLGITMALILMTGWVIWLFSASIPIVISAEHAHVEWAGAVVVTTPISGQVATIINPGQQVGIGDILVRIEGTDAPLQLRAPIIGRFEPFAALRQGVSLQAGEAIGLVAPSSDLVVIALFDATVFGQVVVGQSAELQVLAPEAAQITPIPAIVHRVERNSDGLVRAELRLADSNDQFVPGITLHAMVVTEEVSPVILLLRSVGWLSEARS